MRSYSRRRVLAALGGLAGLGTGGSRHVTADSDENGDETDDVAEIYDAVIDDVVLVAQAGLEAANGPIGSGFVAEIDDERHVVTNYHVVGGADSVECQFVDEQWRTAEVLGTDVQSDLAVLEIDDLPTVADGRSVSNEIPAIGESVLALGNPLGLDASVSGGIVSGVDRSLQSPAGFAIPAAIQTDAPVDPGNSGGPLVDMEGTVVGVVFAGAGRGIGFAIAGPLANRVAPALATDGEYAHPHVGIGVEPVSPALADANDLEEPRGVLVIEIVPDSPADGTLESADEVAISGGQALPVGGDVVVAIDGEAIPNQDRLFSYLALETAPGDEVTLEVVRDGEEETAEVTLEERPEVDIP